MKMNGKQTKIFKWVLAILSLLASGDLFFVMGTEIYRNQLIGVKVHLSFYLPIIFFALLFIVIAGLYFIIEKRSIRIVQNSLLIITLGFTFASIFTSWPAFLSMDQEWLTMINELLLSITVIAGLVFTNMPSLTDNKHILLFCLKFVNVLLALFAGVYIFVALSVGGSMFLQLPIWQQNLAIVGLIVLMMLNLVYAIVIWLKHYHGWWTWICAVLIAIEINWPFFHGNSMIPVLSLWMGILQAIVILIAIFGMNYLNEKLN
ncbi:MULTISPECIES: hypothetical protein [Lactobacillus]|uniref:Uncharacterized protein n=1 Tax=Lactobacillus xujianguonis TaxID=2495899 RepID=A0A437STR4_9LACO|nr:MULTISPECIES: hypothetical protein [Lactobacillus]RVU70336.1 hypothetical protein EJK17_08150 [Lactobacillus xujianguonis]RVU76879.1 hypothetical protein EJK20_03620 [Lactobacillus xujianguonis]